LGFTRQCRDTLFLFSIIGFVFNAQVFAEDSFTPVPTPSISIPRSSGAITIDGKLDEAAWATAVSLDHFHEYNPVANVKPAVRTRVFLAYDENNLYVAFMAYDKGDEVRASLTARDNIWADDFCGVLIDTYGDQTIGYGFYINPLGIQGDVRYSQGGDEDSSFDLIYFSDGQVTDSGYQVEVAIPFASIRFPDTKEQHWRFNLWRNRPREHRYQYSWSANDRNNDCFMCKWGYLNGISDISPSSNLEILPNIIGYQSGKLSDSDDPLSHFDNSDPDAEVSLNVRYGVTSNSSAEITINPDFSQVESDAGQIDVNNTFGLYFSERRPFFQEGSDQFSTWIDAIYTRSINDPEVAGKFTGQFGKTSMAYLVAYDKHSPMVLPMAERSLQVKGDASLASVFRIRRAFGDNSYVGFLATDRRFSDWSPEGEPVVDYTGGSGSNAGIDTRVRFTKKYSLEFQLVGSYTREPVAPGLIDIESLNADTLFDYDKHTVAYDGEKFGGHAIYLSFERGARTWDFDIDYYEFSPTFRTDNGFTTRNDYREVSAWTGLLFRPQKTWLINIEPAISFGRIWDFDKTLDFNPTTFTGGSKDEWFRPELWMQLRGQTEVYGKYTFSRERFAGHLFEGISIVYAEASTHLGEMLTIGSSLRIGRQIYRDRSAPEMAMGYEYSLDLDIKPNRQMLISPRIDYYRLNHLDKYFDDHPDLNRADDKNIYSGYILRTRVTYQFTKQWFLRLVVQYDDFDEQLDIEPLLTWQLNPFSVFYVGMNSSQTRFHPNADNTDFNRTEWVESSRQFFAKLQYLFRM